MADKEGIEVSGRSEAKKKEFTNEYCKYLFSKSEIDELSTELAQRVAELANAEADKKAIVSDLTAKINSVQALMDSLAGKVNNGYEMRNVKCEIVKDYDKGRVTHVRSDTLEVVRTRLLGDDDRQTSMLEE